MKLELRLSVVLLSPPAGVDFGLQFGKGIDYETIQKQTSKGSDLRFAFSVTVKDAGAAGPPVFLGPLTQGPPNARFIYIDVGKAAGQQGSVWERRIKVPLAGITRDMVEQATADPKRILQARLPGTAKDGGPSCATVRPIDGWEFSRDDACD